MIRPVTYTYKGRPISAGSRKNAGGFPRRRKRRSVFVTVFCLILILGAAAALGWWLFSCFRAAPAADEEIEDGSDVTSFQEAGKPAASAPVSGPVAAPRKIPPTPAVTPPPPAPAVKKPEQPPRTPARLSESADRQALRIYSAAAAAFQKKDYEKARKALRLLFEKIQLPPSHPLYDRACAMLSDSSLAVYRTGDDPRDWKTHKVERGESLSRIARKYGTDVPTLTEVNKLSGTALRIGQTLRIPQGSWRIRIERKNQRLLLDSSGRLFKIYPITVGPRGESAVTGLYRVRRRQEPDRILLQGSSPSLPGASLHSKENEPDPAQSCFVMKQSDLAELLLLIPEKTPGEILK